MDNLKRYLDGLTDIREAASPYFLWDESKWQDGARQQLQHIRKRLREAEQVIEAEAIRTFAI